MPIDRELAYESLKWIDPKVYRMYLRLRYRGMTSEQVEKDANFFKMYLDFADFTLKFLNDFFSLCGFNL